MKNYEFILGICWRGMCVVWTPGDNRT